jgi:hypothetical protein
MPAQAKLRLLQPEQIRAIQSLGSSCPQCHGQRPHCPFFRLGLLSHPAQMGILQQMNVGSAVSLFQMADESCCAHARSECEKIFGSSAWPDRATERPAALGAG